MKRIILTSGPRGTGKSTYSKDFVKKNSNVKYISRDEILMELFGDTSLDPYSGAHLYAHQIFIEKLKDVIRKSDSDLDLIVDAWNGSSECRKDLIRKFKSYGADRVLCWNFITGKDISSKWFMQKEDVNGYSIESNERDYDLYHEFAKDIENDGFDKIYYINPAQLTLDFPTTK